MANSRDIYIVMNMYSSESHQNIKYLFTNLLKNIVKSENHALYSYNIMIAGIPFVLGGQLKTNTPHYIHYF